MNLSARVRAFHRLHFGLKHLRIVGTVCPSSPFKRQCKRLGFSVSDERRKDRRVPLLIEMYWAGKSGKHEARTSDLSEGGCFVDTFGEASVGDVITFELQLPNGEWMKIQGEVTFVSPRAGFGVRFTNMAEADRKKMEWLVKAGQYEADKNG